MALVTGMAEADAFRRYTTFYWVAEDNDAGLPPDRWVVRPAAPPAGSPSPKPSARARIPPTTSIGTIWRRSTLIGKPVVSNTTTGPTCAGSGCTSATHLMDSRCALNHGRLANASWVGSSVRLRASIL